MLRLPEGQELCEHFHKTKEEQSLINILVKEINYFPNDRGQFRSVNNLKDMKTTTKQIKLKVYTKECTWPDPISPDPTQLDIN